MLYVASIYARKQAGGDIIMEHAPKVFKANSSREAVGTAYLQALTQWPKADGWQSHSVVVLETVVLGTK